MICIWHHYTSNTHRLHKSHGCTQNWWHTTWKHTGRNEHKSWCNLFTFIKWQCQQNYIKLCLWNVTENDVEGTIVIWFQVHQLFACSYHSSMKFVFSRQILENTLISDFMKILALGAKGHADGQTDMTKLIVALRNFAKAPKNQFV
jgi:hypothetical protein